MTYQALKMKPGVDVERTPLLNETSFSFSKAVRFFQGLLQKLGGWAHLNNQKLIGTVRGMHAWADLAGNPYIAAGSEQRLELFAGGAVYDITPIRVTHNPAVSFSTTAGLDIVTIRDVGHGALATDWINIQVRVSVGGIILSGFYQVVAVVDPDHYTIKAAQPATGTIANGGAVPSFATLIGDPNVTATFNNHGLIVNNPFTVDVLTAIGGFNLLGDYAVTNVVDANTVKFQPGGNAGATAVVNENGGNTRIAYLIHTGAVSSSVAAGQGYGQGIYGQGVYGGAGGSQFIIPLREWFLDNFGQQLIGNYTGSPIYVWSPPAGSGPAIAVDTINFPGALNPPTRVNISFMAAPQRMLVALGCDDPENGGVFDPLLVRWCDVEDFTDWTASATNQAGSYIIPSGSTLRGGVSSPNFTVLWTDIDMWLMNYLGGTGQSELVWGFNKIAVGVDLLSGRAVGVHRNAVYWAASNGFFSFNGQAVTPIECPVWDKFWNNLDRMQSEKVNCQVNSWFQEISWAFPAQSGEVEGRITLHLRDNTWTYEEAPVQPNRTAWVDDNVYGAPVGADLNGYLQQHETSNDNDGVPLISNARTGWFSVGEGELVGSIERIEADFIATGGDQTIQMTVLAQDYATGPVRTYGPYTWQAGQGPPVAITRARGRFFSIIVGSTGAGSFWRLGNLRYRLKSTGRRP